MNKLGFPEFFRAQARNSCISIIHVLSCVTVIKLNYLHYKKIYGIFFIVLQMIWACLKLTSIQSKNAYEN